MVGLFGLLFNNKFDFINTYRFIVKERFVLLIFYYLDISVAVLSVGAVKIFIQIELIDLITIIDIII